MDLKTRFEHEVGTGPAQRDVTERLDAGRVLVRRRRRLTGVIGGGVALGVLAVLPLLPQFKGDPELGREVQPPLASESPDADAGYPTEQDPACREADPTPIAYNTAGDVCLQTGWAVVDRIDHPFRFTNGTVAEAAFKVRNAQSGREQFRILHRTKDGSDVSGGDDASGRTLREWVDQTWGARPTQEYGLGDLTPVGEYLRFTPGVDYTEEGLSAPDVMEPIGPFATVRVETVSVPDGDEGPFLPPALVQDPQVAVISEVQADGRTWWVVSWRTGAEATEHHLGVETDQVPAVHDTYSFVQALWQRFDPARGAGR